jgi:hypothetical protein
MTPEAAKRYKPRRPEMTLDDVVTPAERERRARDVQEAKDQSAQEAATREYEKIMPTPEKYSKGGSASKRADGIAQRGKTRGTLVMCGGGYMKGKK